MEDFVGDLIGGGSMESSAVLTLAEVFTNASTVVSEVAKAVGTVAAIGGFVFAPMAFKFGRKMLGMAKGMLMYSRGRR